MCYGEDKGKMKQKKITEREDDWPETWVPMSIPSLACVVFWTLWLESKNNTKPELKH